MPIDQGKWWLLTLPAHTFLPYLPGRCAYIRGQLERGAAENLEIQGREAPAGFLHWQVIICFKEKVRRGGVRNCFGPYHCELSRSAAAREYVWKEDTAVPGTRLF